MMLRRLRRQDGALVIDVLVALTLVVALTGPFYGLVLLTSRGWTLLQGQVDVQQYTRAAADWVITDLRQARDYAVTSGTTVTLQITKPTVMSCAAAQGAPDILVATGGDLAVGSTVAIQAFQSRTIVTIATIGTGTCPATGLSAVRFTLVPILPAAFPAGALVYPINALTLKPLYNITYLLNASKQLSRNGQVLAEGIDGLCLREHRSTLSTNASVDAEDLFLVSKPTGTCPYATDSNFSAGDMVVIQDPAQPDQDEVRTVDRVTRGSTVRLTLDKGIAVARPKTTTIVRTKLLTVEMTMTLKASSPNGRPQQAILTGRVAPRN